MPKSKLDQLAAPALVGQVFEYNGENSIILWLMNHPVAQVYHDRVEVD